MSMLTSRCCNVSPSLSPSARSAIPASSCMIRASSVCSKSSYTVAVTSAAGPPSKSIKSLSPPSTSPTDPTASTSCAMIYANSKVTACCSGMDPATPTASPRKASRSRCSFSSSTNGSAVRSPTAASTTAPSPITSHTVNWKPHITAPTEPFNRSSICLRPDLYSDSTFVKLFLSKIRPGRIYKSRLVPFGPKLEALLVRYLRQRHAAVAGAPADDHPLFCLRGGRPINPGTVSQTFHALVPRLHLQIPPGVSPPRLHDLRHSFAVGTLTRWYRLGLDPQARLLALSTFMGHVDVNSTAVYLTTTPELLEQASRRFRAFAAATLMEGLPS